jgi:hypothetical protein
MLLLCKRDTQHITFLHTNCFGKPLFNDMVGFISGAFRDLLQVGVPENDAADIIPIPPHRRRNERQHAQGIIPLKTVTQSKRPIGRLPEYTGGRLGDASQDSFGRGGIGRLLFGVPFAGPGGVLVGFPVNRFAVTYDLAFPMPARVRVVHRRVEDIGIAVVALRVVRVRNNRIRRDKPPHLRQVIAGVHVDKAQVVGAGVVMPVAGEALIRHRRVSRRRGAIVTVGVKPRQGVAGEGAALSQPGNVAQVVGEGLVVRARARAHLRLDSNHLPGQAVGRAVVRSCGG